MFKRKHRLAKFKDVKRTFAQGRSFFNPFYRVKFLHSQDNLRLTVVVSSKVSKKAVERNSLKRKIREFLKQQQIEMRSGDYVIELKPKVVKLSKQEQREELYKLLKSAKLV